jgi:hypothetical protein
MGSLEVGSFLLGTVGQIKVGSSDVQAIYAGTTLVFPQPTTTTTTTTTSTTTSTTTVAPTTTTTTTSTTTSTTTDTPTTTTTTTTSTTTSTTTINTLYSCNVTIDPFSSDTQFTYDLGTTSGTVSLTSDAYDCGTAVFRVYYPATIGSPQIYTGKAPGSFNYVYDGINTTVLVVHDTSAC